MNFHREYVLDEDVVEYGHGLSKEVMSEQKIMNGVLNAFLDIWEVLEKKPKLDHRICYCAHCERMTVICGKCGNNCCNGTYGVLTSGKSCDACPEAYKIQDQMWSEEESK